MVHVIMSFQAEVPVRVVGIKFDIRPPVLAILKLQVVDWETGEVTPQTINHVVWHDVKDVVDFLILRQLYDRTKRHNWNVNDRSVSRFLAALPYVCHELILHLFIITCQ